MYTFVTTKVPTCACPMREREREGKGEEEGEREIMLVIKPETRGHQYDSKNMVKKKFPQKKRR